MPAWAIKDAASMTPKDKSNILHTNTLTENLADIQEQNRFDVVLANPPFGGKERKEVQQNFPIRTGETTFLFLQHHIKILRAGARNTHKQATR
jgi:type I restriction enzyme M protein